MKRKTVRQKVWSFIEQPSDPALLTSEFLKFGSRSQINRVLNQLIEEKLIKRAGYAVYVRAQRFVIPKTQEVVYIAMHGVDAVARSMLLKRGIETGLTEAQEEYNSGGSQIPLDIIHTKSTRITRKIQIGKSRVRFTNNFIEKNEHKDMGKG